MAGYPLDPMGDRGAPTGWTGIRANQAAPDGGNGPGHSQSYAQTDPHSEGWFWGAVHGTEHFLGSAYDYGAHVAGEIKDRAIRVAHVAQAIYIANDYAPGAIMARIGMDVQELLSVFIPGLLMSLGVLALSTLVGAAAAGALAGILSAGMGAVPAAVAGGELGFDAGLAVLNGLGIGFLLKDLFAAIPKIFEMARAAVEIAWDAGSDPKRPAITDVDRAAQGLAKAEAEMVNVLVQGVLVWILSKSAVARTGKLAGAAKDLNNPTALATRGGQVLEELKTKPAEARAALQAGAAELAAQLRRLGAFTRGLADFVQNRVEQILKHVTEDARKSAEALKGEGGGGDGGGADPSGRPAVPRSTEAVVAPSRVATRPNEAFFWSGRTNGVGGASVAAKYASAANGTTLEQLIESRNIQMPDWNPNDPASVQAWKDLSAEYAQGASGTVRAVIGQDLRAGNVWETSELPALKNNPNVDSIIRIDPATGAQSVLFQR